MLGAGAAAAGWVAVLVALNLTGNPWVSAGAFAGLATLALTTGMRRLLVLSVVVGLGLVVAMPGLALADGSFSFTYGSGNWAVPHGAPEWLLAACTALRIPAQVLATALLLLVPAPLLLASASRLSPRSALLGGLAARLRPLLLRDLRLVRDELASRGWRSGRGVPIAERMRSGVALWEAAVFGMLDRSFQTAAALDTRGFGAGRPTVAPFEDPELQVGESRRAGVDGAVVAASVLLVAGTIAARSWGLLVAPSAQAFGNAQDPTGPLVGLLALVGASIGLLPLWPRTRATRSGTTSASASVALPAPVHQPLAVSVTAGEVVLRARSISMSYPAAVAPSLVDVGFELRAGELVVCAGASGSGKSTLLDVVTGVAPRTTGGQRTGELRLGDHVARSAGSGARGQVAAVFQDPESQILVGPVAEEVAFGLRHCGRPLAEIEQRVRQALDQLGIRHLARRDCATLSGGELQRVLLAAALAFDPAVLVLDEPTSQIDATSEQRFWAAVDAARRERGIAVLAAEHRLEHVLGRADRVLVFDAGRIVADVAPCQVATVAPHLSGSAYAGLVPNPVAAVAPRLVVEVPRLDVPGAATAPSRTLLRDLSVRLAPRAIVTLEGPNGTGKSTLLRTIRGVDVTGSHVLVDGVRRADVGASVRQIAYLSQGGGAMLPGRTVRHAAEETCRRLGLDPAPAHAALAAAGLAGRRDSHPSELSVGERQRLALVATTAHRPPVWLLDEPTRGMDVAARRWVACHVLAHAAAGGVVLVATHDAELAAAIATHRLRLDLRTGPSLIAVERDVLGAVVTPDGTASRTAPVPRGPEAHP